MEIETATTIEKPGAYRMTAERYHADPCPEPSLSSSVAKLILDATPLHAWHAHPKLNPAWTPDDSTRRLTLGSVCHALLIGQGREIVPVDFDSFRKAAAQEARDAAFAAGKLPVLVSDLEHAREIVDAARWQLARRGLTAFDEEHGAGEVVVAAQTGGVWTRAMPDWWTHDGLTVYDYKTVGALVSPARFARHVAEMGYDVQDAHYLSTVGAAFPELDGRVRFVIVAQEIAPPYALATYELTEADRSVARRKVETAVAAWSTCLASGIWPAYPERLEPLALPSWHAQKWLDRELDESGDPLWSLVGGAR